MDHGGLEVPIMTWLGSGHHIIILDMVDFYVIVGMDWLSHCHMIMDYFSKIISLAMPSIPTIVW